MFIMSLSVSGKIMKGMNTMTAYDTFELNMCCKMSDTRAYHMAGVCSCSCSPLMLE